MSKQNINSLLQLINCLTKAEKRHFKLLARRNSGDKDSLFIQLFDFLDKNANSDDSEIVRKIKGIKKTQLANIKANLYRQLLGSLRIFHRTSNENINLSEQLDYARVLYEKGLYKSSLEVLEKAKLSAFDKKQYMIAQNIVEFEKHIESQHVTGSMSEKADELNEQSKFLINRNLKYSTLSSSSLQLYGLYLKYGYVRNEKDYHFVTEYFNANLPRYEIADLDFYEKMYYYQSYVWYENMCHDFLNYFKYSQKWVGLFHEYPEMVEKEMSSYLKGLHNVLNALFLIGRYDKFINALEELTHFNKDLSLSLNRNEQSLWMMFQYIHKINRHYMEGTFSQGLDEIPPLEKILEHNKYNWDTHRIMVFYYKIACLYFGAGHHEEAIKYLNKIINDYIPGFREDIQSFSRILNLIAHFELGNELLISYQIKSVYRFLLKMNDLHAVLKEIFKFLRKTPRILRKDLKKEFLNLKSRLLIIQDEPFEKRPFLYLDIISWLESRIEDVPVEKIIRRNFTDEYEHAV